MVERATAAWWGARWGRVKDFPGLLEALAPFDPAYGRAWERAKARKAEGDRKALVMTARFVATLPPELRAVQPAAANDSKEKGADVAPSPEPHAS